MDEKNTWNTEEQVEHRGTCGTQRNMWNMRNMWNIEEHVRNMWNTEDHVEHR